MLPVDAGALASPVYAAAFIAKLATQMQVQGAAFRLDTELFQQAFVEYRRSYDTLRQEQQRLLAQGQGLRATGSHEIAGVRSAVQAAAKMLSSEPKSLPGACEHSLGELAKFLTAMAGVWDAYHRDDREGMLALITAATA